MKKWLCLFFAGVLTFSLVACGKSQNTDPSNNITGTKPTGNVTETKETKPNNYNVDSTVTDISSLSLQDAYAYAVQQHKENPQSHRDICELQPETQQIIELDGKYYQSYVSGNVDIRYIWISHSEFPDDRISLWDWYAVGTANTYSLEQLGKIDEGHMGEIPATEPDDSKMYAIKEVSDDRVTVADGKKIFSDSFITITFPLEWKCLEQQGEDGRNIYFQDPISSDKCQFSIHLSGAIYVYQRTQEEYLEYFSHYCKDPIIESLTKETIQRFQCTKVVYSYTDNGTKFIEILYDNLIEGPRLFDFRITYPVTESETYSPIFESMIESIQFIEEK